MSNIYSFEMRNWFFSFSGFLRHFVALNDEKLNKLPSSRDTRVVGAERRRDPVEQKSTFSVNLNKIHVLDLIVYKIFLVNLSLMCALLVGCEKQYMTDESHVSKMVELEVSESKESEFFELDRRDCLAREDIPKMKKFLRDAKARGVNEVSFLITLNKPIKDRVQEKIRRRVMAAAYWAGFISSRIINSGTLIYEGAKRGVRIDALKYDIKEPDCSPWSEYIGDIDTNKNLPRFGASDKYNLREMIANDADIVSPRRYKGQSAQDAINAAGIKK